MAWLIFTDGTRREVRYDTAAQVYQILKGNAKIEPDKPRAFETREMFEASDEYKKKETFLLTVADVQFDSGTTNSGPKPWEAWKKNDS